MAVVKNGGLEWSVQSQEDFDGFMKELNRQASHAGYPERLRVLARIAILQEEYPDFYRVYDDGERIVRGLE
jgi:hypothetical protein